MCRPITQLSVLQKTVAVGLFWMNCNEVIARRPRRHELGEMVEFLTIRYSVRLILFQIKRTNRLEKSLTTNMVHIGVKPDFSSLMPDILCISLRYHVTCVDIIDRVVF
jgi:hypothetical protein